MERKGNEQERKKDKKKGSQKLENQRLEMEDNNRESFWCLEQKKGKRKERLVTKDKRIITRKKEEKE